MHPMYVNNGKAKYVSLKKLIKKDEKIIDHSNIKFGIH